MLCSEAFAAAGVHLLSVSFVLYHVLSPTANIYSGSVPNRELVVELLAQLADSYRAILNLTTLIGSLLLSRPTAAPLADVFRVGRLL